MKKRLSGALLAVLAMVVVAAPAAQAAKPTMSQFEFTNSTSVTDICPTPFHLEVHALVKETVFTNASGDVTRIIDRATEHDTFSGHGTTIRTASYHYTIHVLFDDAGNLVHAYATGTVVRMRLPDGTLFNAAGRVDVANSSGPFTITPDVGHSGNLAAFCDALS
jgi:hypothetical protein